MGLRFRVALSFPGDRRDYVEKVAARLAATLGRERILYDRFYEAEFARPNLDVHLQELYHDHSELIVVFLCADYEKKEWCGLEWRAVRDLVKKRRAEMVMPLRFDVTEIPGLFSTDGYLWLEGRSPEDAAAKILERLGWREPAPLDLAALDGAGACGDASRAILDGLEKRRLALKAEVDTEVRQLLLRLVREVPGWVESMEIKTSIVLLPAKLREIVEELMAEIAGKLRYRLEEAVEFWIGKILKPRLEAWIPQDEIDRYGGLLAVSLGTAVHPALFFPQFAVGALIVSTNGAAFQRLLKQQITEAMQETIGKAVDPTARDFASVVDERLAEVPAKMGIAFEARFSGIRERVEAVHGDVSGSEAQVRERHRLLAEITAEMARLDQDLRRAIRLLACASPAQDPGQGQGRLSSGTRP